MKTVLIFGILALILIVGCLYNYRQRMIKPISESDKIELSNRTISNYFRISKNEPLPYRLFVPDGADGSSYFPLVLYLHGAGGRGADNLAQLDNIVGLLTSESFQKEFRSYVLAPQCPVGHQWVDLQNESLPYRNYDQRKISESPYLVMTRKIINKIRSNYHIDEKRIYIIGYSMGATGVWDIITRHPKAFAGAIILNGRSDPSQASKISDLPLWVSHGKFDRVSPISNARAMISQLNKFDGNVIFKELYWGHGITRVALKGQEPFRWLFKQQKPF